MIVSELKEYIQQHNGASRKELATHFALSEDGVDAMLEIWIRKGQLSKSIALDKGKGVKEVRYRWNRENDIPLTIIS